MTSFGYFFIQKVRMKMFRGKKCSGVVDKNNISFVRRCLRGNFNLPCKFGFSNVMLVRIRCFLSQLENWHRFRFWRKQIAWASAKKCGELWRNGWVVRWWRHGGLTVNGGWRAQMRVMMVRRRHVMSSVVVMLLVISGGKMVQRRFTERRAVVVVVAATNVAVWLQRTAGGRCCRCCR